jgi:hypothetical protein
MELQVVVEGSVDDSRISGAPGGNLSVAHQ